MLRGVGVFFGSASAIALGFLCYQVNPASFLEYLVTVLNGTLAIFAYVSEPRRKVNRAFALFGLLAAAWGADMTFLFLAPTQTMADVGLRFVRLGLLYVYPAAVYFTLVFTRREHYRWMLRFTLAWSTLLAAASVLGWMHDGVRFNGVNWYPIANRWYDVYSLLLLWTIGVTIGLSAVAWRSEQVPRLRLQYRQFFFANVLLWSLALINQVATYASKMIPAAVPTYSFLGALGGVVFFVIIAFAIVRHQWLDISFVIRRTLLYSTLTAGIATTYGVMLALFQSLLQGEGQISTAASVATIAVVSFGFLPAREWLQQKIDRLFYRDGYDDRQVLHQLTETIVRVIGGRQISETVLDGLVPTMKIRKAQIMLSGKIYEKVFQNGVTEKSAPRIPVPEGLVDRIDVDRNVSEPLTDYLNREGLDLAFPIASRDSPVGILLVGSKLSELPYRPEEYRILRTVARQAGLAVENSRLYEEVLSVKNYNENILRSMDDGLVTFDSNGVLVSENPAAQRILGTKVTGLSAAEGFQSIPSLAMMVSDVLQRGIAVQHMEVRYGPESEQTLLVTSTTLGSQEGHPIGGLLLFADVTHAKELERRLERDRRLAVVGELASQLAHEIRNPIASIKLLVESLPQKKSDPIFEKMFMRTVPTEIDRLNNLVSELLDFARPPRLLLVPLDPVDIIEASVRLIASDLASVKIIRDFPDPHPEVQADGEKMKQVFINLMKNASEAMQNSPTKELHLRITRKVRTRIEITDTGKGIDARQMPKIFTPFFSTKKEGTGLGLAVVHRIIEDHGWTIEVHSQVGVGTTFTIVVKD